MADAAEELLQKISRKYGTGTPSPSPAPAPAPTPPPTTAPAPPPPPTTVESIANRNRELKKVANYKCGGLLKGMASGGVVGDYPQERPRPAQEPKKSFTDHIKGIVDLITGPAKPGPETKPPTADTLHDTRSNILKRKMAVDQAANYACGGRVKKMAKGGVVRKPGDLLKFSGPGGPRADKIPVKVAGKNINVSNGESAVILPAKTTQNRDALMAIGGIIQASNDGIAPKMGLKHGGKYAKGSLPDPAPTAQEVYAPVTRAVGSVADAVKNAPQLGAPLSIGGGNPAPTAQEVYGATTNVVRTGNSFSAAPSVQTSAEDAFKPGGVPSIPGFQASPNAGGTLDPRGALDLGARTGFGLPPPVAPAPAAAAPTTNVSRTGNSFTAAAPAPGAATPAVAPGAVDKAARTGQGPGDAQVNPATGTLSFTGKGFDPTKQQFADGTGAITDPRTGRTMMVTGATPAAPGAMLRSGEVDAYGNSTAITKQLKGELAAATADNDAAYARQSAGLQASIAHAKDYDARQRADADRFTRFSNEADTAALMRDAAAGRADRGQIAALGAMQARDAANRSQETQLAHQDSQETMARGREATLSKGQQLQHDTAMAQVLGSPLHQQGQILDAAIKAGTVNQAQAMQGLQQQLIAAGKAGDTKTQNALAQMLRQLAGKDEQLGQMLQIGGGEVWDEQAGMMRKQPMSVAHTGDRAPSIVGAPASAKPATKFEVGKTYTDAKGNKATYQADGTWK